jgi:type II restriction/modification system DNA methylase subunit YeeA
MTSMTAHDFVQKWQCTNLKERAAAQEHFLDLCHLLGQKTPAEAGPTGDRYTFERKVTKTTGGKGFADVWKRGHFAWEYKGKRKNLQDAYLQLLLYREDLENPPLLVVSDIETIEIHTNFTGSTKRVYRLTLDDLLKPEKLDLLRRAFTDPGSLNPKFYRERITQDATARIGDIALRLRERGEAPEAVAHFMMQLVFALFAEDISLLPNRLVTKILEKTKGNPDRAQQYLTSLFHAMSTGGEVLLEDVPYFNGGLFQSGDALHLESDELIILLRAAELDWGEVEPAIFGTLFERSLDPEKRSQLGAHYTSREDILRVVGPVIMQPLREEWERIRTDVEKRLERGHGNKAAELISTFLNKLHRLKVLDPACGSGNFLYVAMQQLKDLEKEVVTLAQSVGAPGFALIGPRQFYGIELNVFAQELASMVCWIGYLQWNRANGETNWQTPILEKLDNIRLHDALINEDGTEYEWPEADFIIGNPPFLGSKKLRLELSDDYVHHLFRSYKGRVPNSADLVCYWFEKARSMIHRKQTRRAGFIATNSIRQSLSRPVLDAIRRTGNIFMAWQDEPWILEGAAVRVSLVGFDDGSEARKTLNGSAVPSINADLTSGANFKAAEVLRENARLCFRGVEPGGPFSIDEATAHEWMKLPNPHGRSNKEVLRPYVNAQDLAGKPSKTWIVDFNELDEEEASSFVVPYDHVKTVVKPIRQTNRDEKYREFWWRHRRTVPELRENIQSLRRYIVTPVTSKHRFFMWLSSDVLPSNLLNVVVIEDNYTFGVLHSKAHEVWSLCLGTSLEDRPRYTPSTCFETFPFPRPTREQHDEVAKWAKYLDDVRNQLLSSDDKLTMTKLYNELEPLREKRDTAHRAYPLLLAHEKLDEAVAAAYGWEWPLEEEEVLSRLLALNLERAAGQGEMEVSDAVDDEDAEAAD